MPKIFVNVVLLCIYIIKHIILVDVHCVFFFLDLTFYIYHIELI